MACTPIHPNEFLCNEYKKNINREILIHKQELQKLTSDFFIRIGYMRGHCRSGNVLSNEFRDSYINFFADSYLAFTGLNEVFTLTNEVFTMTLDEAKEIIKNILIEIATTHDCYS